MPKIVKTAILVLSFSGLFFVSGEVPLSAAMSEAQSKARQEVYKAFAERRIGVEGLQKYISEINKDDESADRIFKELSAGKEEKPQGIPEVKINYKRSTSGRNARTAVWIEDSNGKLITTLYRSVGGVIKPFPVRLIKWEAKTGKLSDNASDVNTSATYNGGSAGQAYTFTWNCRDSWGKLVPDGEYFYKVENARYYAPPIKTQSNLSSGKIIKGKETYSSQGSIDDTPPALLTSLSAVFKLRRPGDAGNETEKPAAVKEEDKFE
ncbi:MAG: DUF2271 domain-containing protein [Candidatus Firestonebacteria bacterium]